MIYLTLILSFFGGYYLREILDTLKHIKTLIRTQNSSDKPKPTATFADPMTKAEVIALMEEERVEAMNR